MDYYSILGVAKNASEKELKSAYKKLSMQHHPDRGGNEETFKKVNEAYSTLKDPQKRGMYDHEQNGGGQAFNFNTGNMGGHPFEDIFGSMFGQGFAQQRRQPRNADVNIKVTIDFEEQLIGKKILATYRLRNGQEERVDLDIPPGIRHGAKIKYQGLGDSSLPGPRGDMYVVISVKGKVGWRRSNDDLVVLQKVNCLDLITGARVTIKTLDGKNLDLNIPSGTKNNTTFNIPGYGVPNTRSKVRGNMLVTVEADIPKLSQQQIEQILKLK